MAQGADAVAAKKAPAPARQPDGGTERLGDLTEEWVFRLLLAEIAAQRGEWEFAAQTYLDAAKRTRDKATAKRATELALLARNPQSAIEAAGLWLELEPGSIPARQTLVAMLFNTDRLADARPHLEGLLAAEKNAGSVFFQISGWLARNPNRTAVLELLRGLAAKHPDVPEARFVVAQAAATAGNEALALAEARAAAELKPDWEAPVLFQAQLLQRKAPGEALDFLRDYLATHPKAKDARLHYGRLLAAAGRAAEAKAEFEQLARDYPAQPEVALAVGLLSLQLKDLQTAETYLRRALDLNYADADAVRFYLGQVAEQQKRPDQAIEWYGAVEKGNQHVPAQIRLASVLAKQGKLEQARERLKKATARSIPERVQLAQAEAQILRDAREYQQSYQVLEEALNRFPDQPELLYDQAMAAERLNRLDVLETNLRRVMQLQPNHAHAYNALGYSFADRNERLEEAEQFIDKGLSLAPEDPFILDSKGWVLYRRGRIAESLDYLERAARLRADPEIAAHLGEVLWAAGRQEDARRVWQEAAQQQPDNDLLRQTLKKFLP